jgi:hypothetical protein
MADNMNVAENLDNNKSQSKDSGSEVTEGSDLGTLSGSEEGEIIDSATQSRYHLRPLGPPKNFSKDAYWNLEDEDDTEFDPNARPKKIKKNKPRIRTETTSAGRFLGLPLSFNTKKEDCSWCANFLLGLTGDITDTSSPESSAQNSKQKLERLNMCVACTSCRVAIMTCSLHSMIPSDIKQLVPAFVKQIQSYLAYPAANNTPFTWCNICCKPASSYCCAENTCSLNLCDEHTHALGGSELGLEPNVQEVIRQQMANAVGNERADLSLLLEEGPLYRAVVEEGKGLSHF